MSRGLLSLGDIFFSRRREIQAPRFRYFFVSVFFPNEKSSVAVRSRACRPRRPRPRRRPPRGVAREPRLCSARSRTLPPPRAYTPTTRDSQKTFSPLRTTVRFKYPIRKVSHRSNDSRARVPWLSTTLSIVTKPRDSSQRLSNTNFELQIANCRRTLPTRARSTPACRTRVTIDLYSVCSVASTRCRKTVHSEVASCGRCFCSPVFRNRQRLVYRTTVYVSTDTISIWSRWKEFKRYTRAGHTRLAFLQI